MVIQSFYTLSLSLLVIYFCRKAQTHAEQCRAYPVQALRSYPLTSSNFYRILLRMYWLSVGFWAFTVCGPRAQSRFGRGASWPAGRRGQVRSIFHQRQLYRSDVIETFGHFRSASSATPVLNCFRTLMFLVSCCASPCRRNGPRQCMRVKHRSRSRPAPALRNFR